MMSLRKPIAFETPFTQYIGTDIIGEGGAGRVYKATGDDNNAYAVKLLDSKKATREKMKRFKNEVEFCRRNRHPNIIAVSDYGNVVDGRKDSPFYIMPLCAESLRTLLAAGIPPDKVLYYFSQLLDGVEAAHLQKVIHRDLKPENVLYDEAQDRLLVADFGIAHFEVEDLFTDAETSPKDKLANFQYAAPEQRRRGAEVDCRADIYALGLILNEMFTGLVPYGTRYKTIGDVVPAYGYLDDMITEMLIQSVEERTNSIAEVKRQLIGRGVEFARLQRLNELKQTVVPVTDIDDPLINDPPFLRDANYIRGVLLLYLSRPVNDKWIFEMRNMRASLTFAGTKRPEEFGILGDTAAIRAEEHNVQQIIDDFKTWLSIANRQYAQKIRSEQREEEERQRRESQMEIEELERQRRVRASVRI
jgi:serine/threonine protein kinase